MRTATVIPDNERWLHAPQSAAALEVALNWADAHPASDTQADEVMQRPCDGVR